MEERAKPEDLLFGGSGRGGVLRDGVKRRTDVYASWWADDCNCRGTSAINLGDISIDFRNSTINFRNGAVDLTSRTVNLTSRTVNTPGTVWDSP